jgi:hypothetical protein
MTVEWVRLAIVLALMGWAFLMGWHKGWEQRAASGTDARQRQDREDGPDPKGDGPVPERQTPNLSKAYRE